MRNSTAPLFYFTLKTAPLVWGYLAINTALVLFMNLLHMESSGLDAILQNSWTTIYLAMMVGLLFYNESKPGARPTSMVPLPYGEFLLTRPFTRRSAWTARACVCYAVILAVPLLNLCLSFLKPDMRFFLFSNHNTTSEAAQKLPQYLAAFPGSAVIEGPKHGENTLVAPWGYIMLATAQFLFAAIATLALQLFALAQLPSKLKVGLFVGSAIAVLLAFQWTSIVEPCFFIFTRHWLIITPAVLASIIAAQWLAAKSASNLEIL
jgi:hypothetical protein